MRSLRSAYRLLRRVSTLTALGYFVIYVILSCYAEDLMSTRVAGELPVGIALGLLQLGVTFAAVRWYEHSARRSVDPRALRARQLRGRQGGNAGAGR
ncbi:DUF485 domain-containing protein [Streptomyces sp. 7N604]|uniref:DUF485 domain-containing protein n=1 Tax=Streptomyces sp. 7N604 TaxID=3457415 RepID=UPI003FD6311F